MTIEEMNSTPDKHLCPICSTEVPVRIKLVTGIGVAFVCPNHGHCGFRFDSMTEEQRTKLNPDTWKRRGEKNDH